VLRFDNDQVEAALIGRLDRRKRLVWSMPKGHLEEGETAEQAAVREAQEETGIQSQVIAPLGVIDFWFVAEGRRIHKTVHHFVLKATGGELCDDDIEVEEVAWVPVAELPERLGYADERRLLERVPGLLADAGFDVDVSALMPGSSDDDEGHAGADSA
jgi:8-oxo-dGTP pyrophosphatase MutT (NUDIX family)